MLFGFLQIFQIKINYSNKNFIFYQIQLAILNPSTNLLLLLFKLFNLFVLLNSQTFITVRLNKVFKSKETAQKMFRKELVENGPTNIFY